MTFPLGFIPPCLPKPAKALPAGDAWLHEPKLDGWRVQLVKAGDRIALFTRNGNDLAPRLLHLGEAFGALPVGSCSIDGELVADDEDRIGDVWTVGRAIGSGGHELSLMAFDMLGRDGADIRLLPLVDRKRALEDLVARAGLPCLGFIAPFADGARLLATMTELGLEGVVSKRSAAPYRSGRRSEWLKIKSASWRAKNRDRWRATL